MKHLNRHAAPHTQTRAKFRNSQPKKKKKLLVQFNPQMSPAGTFRAFAVPQARTVLSWLADNRRAPCS